MPESRQRERLLTAAGGGGSVVGRTKLMAKWARKMEVQERDYTGEGWLVSVERFGLSLSTVQHLGSERDAEGVVLRFVDHAYCHRL